MQGHRVTFQISRHWFHGRRAICKKLIWQQHLSFPGSDQVAQSFGNIALSDPKQPGIKTGLFLCAQIANRFHHVQKNLGNDIFCQVSLFQVCQDIAIDDGKGMVVECDQYLLIMQTRPLNDLGKSRLRDGYSLLRNTPPSKMSEGVCLPRGSSHSQKECIDKRKSMSMCHALIRIYRWYVSRNFSQHVLRECFLFTLRKKCPIVPGSGEV